MKTKTGDTASKQDSAFKKEYDAETPSPSGLEDLGFPLSSRRGSPEDLDNVFKKITTSADAAAASTGKPGRDFTPAEG